MQDTKVLWVPDPKLRDQSQMTHFRNAVNEKYGTDLASYDDLYQWSVAESAAFWSEMWSFADVITQAEATQVVDDLQKMPGARWFSGARLNYAENLLRFRDDRTAIRFRGEDRVSRHISYSELYDLVAKTAQALKKAGIKQGDRIVGYIPNLPEAIIAMLATASLGAIWSSTSPDFGVQGVLDRFSQIAPKIVFAADGYFYGGKRFDTLSKLENILSGLPSVETVVLIPYTQAIQANSIAHSISWDEFIDNGASEIQFEALPFDHPLYIMYSSGTTGLPKSIVHSAGGTLLQHLKEHKLHCDLSRRDTIFYFTTCGWMMWNWLVGSLALGATLVLYDGNPFYPDSFALWKMSEALGITVFGTSAKYLDALEQSGAQPGKHFALNTLRAVLSTGSTLQEASFDFVYRDIKQNVMLSSISGGTDIISCFVLGNPTLPVIRGEIQCRGLGMKVEAFSTSGESVYNESGELVCTQAFPSMPIYFWNDEGGEKYHKAYFSDFPGVWKHGDFIEINEHGGIRIYGRSDATLNPGGVRIGTAEIYAVIEKYHQVEDSLVIGQPWGNDERVVLFLKMKEGAVLNDEFRVAIRAAIKQNCSPRHVPALILSCPAIPYTLNGKKVEIAVKQIIQGQAVQNRSALANPEALDFYKAIPELSAAR